MDDLVFSSAIELGALLREHQVSPVEAVETTLARIEALDPALGAFVDVDAERALEQARAVPHDDRRVFAGVPIAIKANTPVDGMIMDHGSRLLAGHRMTHDAHLVRRVRDEGFVIVGTTKTPEFGILPTTEPQSTGPARNPWDPSRTPGGSSGGAAAAVASGMLPIAHGNDGGGSIRIPAACCGLVGLKPSRGRVSRGPDSGDSFLVCDGVLSRTVLDTAAALDVLGGYEVGDATWAAPPGAPYVKAVGRDPRPLRIGVTTANPLGTPPDPEHVAAVRATAEALAQLGHRVEEVEPELPGADMLPLFLTVFAANIALGAAWAQLLAGREAGPDDLEPLSRAMVDRAAATSSTEYLGAVAMLQAVSRRVIALWAGFDVLLVPSLAARPPRIGEIDGTVEGAFERAAHFAPYAGLFNVTGQPAITLPAGMGADGLPTTVQLVGPPLGEDTLLQVASQLEVARPWADRRPSAQDVGDGARMDAK
jgi:amidase